MSDTRIAHGGNLHEAARRHGIPYDAWLDLSTGINPVGYPVPPVPADAWRRLPDDGDGLAACAAQYYHAPDPAHVLPVAGSQAAIRALPALLPAGDAGVAALAYGEYAPAFARHGHRVVALDINADTLPATLRHVIVGNPNNPTAEFVPAERLLAWHAQLAARGGTLIVDEAFADTGATRSLAPHVDRPGLVVLRSVGKFFGLAGIRAGFVLACPDQIVALRDMLGAWTVGGPARHAVAAAFADRAWQAAARERLAADGERLAALLRAHGFAVRATPLFSWTDDPRAAALHAALAACGVWTRHFPIPSSVRIGLPGSEVEWQRLGDALARCVPTLQRQPA
ncbi:MULTISPECIES: threonine-phosphate decarboxylase CobD [Burkholderia]|jgi:cobalamin biosynthetic protein CobC|uniref:threonine-phosphate decarboxylase n=5 Tax=Burkholderia TaxID=32008 RepID=A0A1E3FSS3_9BURK|nr:MULTISPECIES: threonine-phosphate decarboxylase CobD [Burkholderia]KKL43394.1 threonine-phosphate decarboxylase [Burkholderia contaminans LMG 23361]MBA9835312.1 threonine-phosphate decarboxylase [Burkholderia contaminans]MBA9841419.1 threonine-phosphate decarboxylase [Burkholderia contaminans]MBA9867876.1 threonine-phosphate decarboxylase [Burkholderia contaminans]MBA9909367.1 threonine-phosphate decarboxylase [Burkholderia contaminans]